MKNEYRKNRNQSMMLTTLLCPEMKYELARLQNNSVKGLLPFDLAVENGECKTVYDITGQQSLDSWMETERMDAEVFSALLLAIADLYERIAPYLISEEKICLHPDHIFIRNGTQEFSFCFLPETKTVQTDPVRELLEYLMTKIDHQDDRLVQVVYQAYEKSGEPAYRVLDLIGQNVVKGWEAVLKEPKKQKEQKEPKIQRRMVVEESPDTYEDEYPEEPSHEKKSVLSGLFTNVKKKEKKEKQAWFVVEDEEETDAPLNQETSFYEETTTFLNPDEELCKGILRYTGTGEEKDLTIKETPFFIGTKNGIGGMLHSPAVSRLHAKITMAGEVYLLEDLNSTNGTYVNEDAVNYKSPVGLHKKDRIRFADEEYLFL